MVYQPSPLNVNKVSPSKPVVQVHTIYTNELHQLEQLGFTRSNMLIELLNEANGDINVVMDNLVGFK